VDCSFFFGFQHSSFHGFSFMVLELKSRGLGFGVGGLKVWGVGFVVDSKSAERNDIPANQLVRLRVSGLMCKS
jgi:hypothetical protein